MGNRYLADQLESFGINNQLQALQIKSEVMPFGIIHTKFECWIAAAFKAQVNSNGLLNAFFGKKGSYGPGCILIQLNNWDFTFQDCFLSAGIKDKNSLFESGSSKKRMLLRFCDGWDE